MGHRTVLTENKLKNRATRREALYWFIGVTFVFAVLLITAYLLPGMVSDWMRIHLVNPVIEWAQDLVSPPPL